MFVAVCAAIVTLPALIEVNIGTAEAPLIVPVAFYAVTSIAVIGLYLAFAIPIYLRWKHGDRFEVGSWNNGAKYKWMNIIAVVEIVIVSLYLMMPFVPGAVPFSDDFSWKFVNYAPIVTLGALLLLTIWWKSSAKQVVHRARRPRSTRPWSRPSTLERTDARGSSSTRSHVCPAGSWSRSSRAVSRTATSRWSTPDATYVVRWSSSDASLLGIDRDAEHHNTRAAAAAGRRCGGVRLPPGPRDAGDRLPARHGAGRRRLRRPRRPRAGRRCHAVDCTRVRGSPVSSTCSPGRRPTAPRSRSRASPCRRGTTTTPTPGRRYGACSSGAPG